MKKETNTTTNMTILNNMNKEELINHVADLENLLLDLETRLNVQKIKPIGRKEEVLSILKKGPITVDALAKRIGISNRNVSSQLSYLRSDGHPIATDSLGRKFLETQKVETVLRKAV